MFAFKSFYEHVFFEMGKGKNIFGDGNSQYFKTFFFLKIRFMSEIALLRGELFTSRSVRRNQEFCIN
jgi:hypothetical protein